MTAGETGAASEETTAGRARAVGRDVNLLARLAMDINIDHKRIFDYELIGAAYEIRSIVEDVAPHPFDSVPDPAAVMVAARLLHDLITLRRHIPFNTGPSWLLVETFLLLHELSVDADDQAVLELLQSLRRRRSDAVAVLGFLRTSAVPEASLE